jgi:hypothetical protein
MRGRFTIIISIAVVILLLVVLNAVSYVSVRQQPDSELNPNRSTYNVGATGTSALYDLLRETNRQVMRWREPTSALLKNDRNAARPATFVIVGRTRLEFDAEETTPLLRWVEEGGRLVLIDRHPDARLLPSSGNWYVSTQLVKFPPFDATGKPDDMTAGVAPALPSQPTALTRGVEKVLPSKYAALVNIAAEASPSPAPAASKSTGGGERRTGANDETSAPPPPPPRAAKTSPPPAASDTTSPAPVVHLSDNRGPLLVDYAHGKGRIIILSDPFIVANRGIAKEDNLRLAVNVLTGGRDGLIAFDEYHQGHLLAQNELFAYFAGTPVLGMLAQCGIIVLALLWTSGRRFARPLPVRQVDRRSSLEFVASMAELQQRARAYDLAIENIYTRTRRVLARYAGVDNRSPRALIAERVAARSSKLDRRQLEALMFECEEAINGAPVDAKKSLELTARLREVERALGLRMRTRDIRQAKER